jgi:hypothetical protein
LERRNADGTWIPDPVSEGAPSYLLHESCSATPPPCRSLVAGETLLPLAWSGDECAPQCGKQCWPERFQSGTHRLVVMSCATPPERFEGPPFEMPASYKALARLRAATDVAHARAARVESSGFKLGATASAPGHIAGLKEISGTSRDLDSELTAELLIWLRAEGGFNDQLAKRCASNVSVGIVLSHEEASTAVSAARTDLEVDVSCMALNMIENGEELSSSYFDPSYKPIFSILRRLFPNDRQLLRTLDQLLQEAAHIEKPLARPSAH